MRSYPPSPPPPPCIYLFNTSFIHCITRSTGVGGGGGGSPPPPVYSPHRTGAVHELRHLVSYTNIGAVQRLRLSILHYILILIHIAVQTNHNHALIFQTASVYSLNSIPLYFLFWFDTYCLNFSNPFLISVRRTTLSWTFLLYIQYFIQCFIIMPSSTL